LLPARRAALVGSRRTVRLVSSQQSSEYRCRFRNGWLYLGRIIRAEGVLFQIVVTSACNIYSQAMTKSRRLKGTGSLWERTQTRLNPRIDALETVEVWQADKEVRPPRSLTNRIQPAHKHFIAVSADGRGTGALLLSFLIQPKKLPQIIIQGLRELDSQLQGWRVATRLN
jgi:hypothetical protein